MEVQFKFKPQQHVRIHHLGLNCEGRIVRCTYDAGPMNLYSVDYAMNGEVKRGEFYEDELT